MRQNVKGRYEWGYKAHLHSQPKQQWAPGINRRCTDIAKVRPSGETIFTPPKLGSESELPMIGKLTFHWWRLQSSMCRLIDHPGDARRCERIPTVRVPFDVAATLYGNFSLNTPLSSSSFPLKKTSVMSGFSGATQLKAGSQLEFIPKPPNLSQRILGGNSAESA
jgi:hypothetical protein